MEYSAILTKALDALWQVLVVGLLLGAGLPVLFALGIRSLNHGRTVVAAGPDGEVTTASTAGKLGAGACFALCVLGVAFGIVVIIWGKKLFGV
ncbi:MAG TPA: hypothetical protein VFP34_14665 [Microlunatus sp.]|nr:hypothetical protein [Microlunatus sp.]